MKRYRQRKGPRKRKKKDTKVRDVIKFGPRRRKSKRKRGERG